MNKNEIQKKKYIVENVIENIGILSISIIYTIIFMGFCINQIDSIEVYKESYCILDCFVFMMSPIYYMLMVVFPLILTFSFSTKNDFVAVHITKYNSWKHYLKVQEYKVFVYSILYACIFMLVVGIIGSIRVKADFNWNIEQSFFYMKSETTTNMSFIELLLVFLLICIIRNFIIQNILLASLWLKNNILYGIIAVFSIVFFELNQPKMGVLLRLYSLDYYIWSRQVLRLRMVYGVFVYVFIGIIAFYFITSRKEVIQIEKI